MWLIVLNGDEKQEEPKKISWNIIIPLLVVLLTLLFILAATSNLGYEDPEGFFREIRELFKILFGCLDKCPDTLLIFQKIIYRYVIY